jgi:hypothetical protein
LRALSPGQCLAELKQLAASASSARSSCVAGAERVDELPSVERRLLAALRDA